ncbi:Transcription factor bHLH113 [Zea mays]|uniref:Transcription factor bHLH113 n=1 Tax=Zea mays TaxID=4577 RepID=A0A1D6L5G9_MAIZE|nr:Transcription factor bHLH113 [Zea mays]
MWRVLLRGSRAVVATTIVCM